jgi:hypothetical protein
MLIAKIENEQIIEVGEYTTLFPNTSFPASGINDSFMVENNCMYVSTTLPYDSATQVLETVPPYIDIVDPENPLYWVYTVIVRDMTPEEVAERHAQLAQQNKETGKQLLQETDWTAIPSVADPAQSTPYLMNQNEFFVYRSAVRDIVLNPTWDAVFPEMPEEIWSS